MDVPSRRLRDEGSIKVRPVGDTLVGLHTEQHLLERSEQAAVIFTVLPTKVDYLTGHVVACEFCFVELFHLTCFHSQLIRKKKKRMNAYHIRWPVNQVRFQVKTLFGHQKFFVKHQNSICFEFP